MKTIIAMALAAATPAPGLAFAADSADAALSKPAVYKAALDAHGVPNLEGVWSNATLTPMERPRELGDRAVYTQAEAAAIDKGRAQDIVNGDKPTDPKLTVNEVNKTCDLRGFKADTGCAYNGGWTDPGDGVNRVAGQPRTSFITFPANGRIPPSKPGIVTVNRAQAGMDRNDNPEDRSLGERCILHVTHAAPVLQPALYNNNYQFVQSKTSVALLIEQTHDVRVIPLNAKHRTDGVRPWMGDSIGHYEGPTLVVETTNFPKPQALRGSWENLKVTERFTRVAADHILYQFKVEDPTVWDQPWGGEYELATAKGMIYEYACHEGNYALEAMLSGARYEEQAARDAAAKKPVADAR